MKTQTQLPEFKGIPLIEISENIPQADFLQGDFGKAVLEEYQERVKEEYNDNKNLKVLEYEDEVIKGSNPFAICLVNQIVREEGLRTATQSDLEKILKLNALNLRGFYEDTSLILRSEDEPNSYLAKDLSEQIKQRQELKYPVMIQLYGLELRNDEDSNYSLAFNLRDDSEIIYVPILNENSENFSSQDIDEKIGLPKKLGEGERYFYTGDSGLSRLSLDDELGLGSLDYHLADSDGDGRVVLVKTGEAGSQKI